MPFEKLSNTVLNDLQRKAADDIIETLKRTTAIIPCPEQRAAVLFSAGKSLIQAAAKYEMQTTGIGQEDAAYGIAHLIHKSVMEIKK